MVDVSSLSVKKRLAQGAYSVVYKCKDGKNDKEYALKRLMVSQQVSFCGSIREIDITMSIQHPYIVKCHGLIEERKLHRPLSPVARGYKDDGFLQTYDFYKEGTLRQYYQETLFSSRPDCSGVDCQEVVKLAFKILLAIEFIHSRGIVHRDLKPENILMDGNNPRLADFGLAQRVQISSSDYFQTLGYRSPELLFCVPTKTYDPRATDVWAFGCILHELLNYGRYIFGGLPTKEEELILEMSKKIDLSIIKEKGNEKYAITPRVEPPSLNIIQYILNPDPTTRPTIFEVMRHPFFESERMADYSMSVRIKNPIFPISMDTLTINKDSYTRRMCCNILIEIVNRQRDNSSWFRYVIIFHALEMIDRIIQSNQMIKIREKQHLVVSILYILIKLFNEDQLREPPSFETFANQMLKIGVKSNGSHLNNPLNHNVDWGKLEYHLLKDILNYSVFRRTPYEYHIDNPRITFPIPTGWSALSLLFMSYTRMSTGTFHVSDVWKSLAPKRTDSSFSESL